MISPSDPVAAFLYDILCEGELPSIFSTVARKGTNTAEIERWPADKIYLPRRMVNEYIMERYHAHTTSYAVTLRMHGLIGSMEDKRMRFDVTENDAMTRTPHLVYTFDTMVNMRAAFVKSFGREIAWPNNVPVAVDETNVVRMDGKEGPAF